MTTKDLMIINVRAYNKVLTKEHLSKLTPDELMNNTHPSDRLDFKRLLVKEEEERKKRFTELQRTK